jgi:hypothetical protein
MMRWFLNFLFGAVCGLLLGWIGGQVTRFDDGYDFALWMAGWSFAWGCLAAFLPGRVFSRILEFISRCP